MRSAREKKIHHRVSLKKKVHLLRGATSFALLTSCAKARCGRTTCDTVVWHNSGAGIKKTAEQERATSCLGLFGMLEKDNLTSNKIKPKDNFKFQPAYHSKCN